MHLGIDLGTSGLKAVLISEKGKIVAICTTNYKVKRQFPGWSEQQPDLWIKALNKVMSGLKTQAKAEFKATKSIGIAGQMHGVVCIDKKHKVIRPCILWNDTRASLEARLLNQNPDLKAVFGNIFFPGFSAPKTLWLKKHEPKNSKQIFKVLLPKDYLRYWLCGEFVSDMSDASGTAWLDVKNRKWSKKLVQASGLKLENLPRLVEGNAAAAKINSKIAAKLGLPPDIVIAGGAGDNAASALGLNIKKPGDGFISLGTSGVVFALSKGFVDSQNVALHSFCHALTSQWHQMGVVLAATDSLNWLAKQLNTQAHKLLKGLDKLNAPDEEIFLPFLGGERTPYNNPKLKAGFYNLSHHTNRQKMVCALLEGVSFAIKESVELIEKSKLIKLNNLTIVGGGARSEFWVNLIATIINRPLKKRHNAEHIAAVGAARLGAMSVKSDFLQTEETKIFEPSSLFTSAFKNKFFRYKQHIKQQLKNTAKEK